MRGGPPWRASHWTIPPLHRGVSFAISHVESARYLRYSFRVHRCVLPSIFNPKKLRVVNIAGGAPADRYEYRLEAGKMAWGFSRNEKGSTSSAEKNEIHYPQNYPGASEAVVGEPAYEQDVAQCPPHTTERKLLARIDLHVIPFLVLLYWLAFLDRYGL